MNNTLRELDDPEMLVQLVSDLESKLKEKNAEIQRVRVKLRTAKLRMVKMKGTIVYQRNRIIELYSSASK